MTCLTNPNTHHWSRKPLVTSSEGSLRPLRGLRAWKGLPRKRTSRWGWTVWPRPGNKPAQAAAALEAPTFASLGREDLSASLTSGPRRTRTRVVPTCTAPVASLRATHARGAGGSWLPGNRGAWVGRGMSAGSSRLLPSLTEPVVYVEAPWRAVVRSQKDFSLLLIHRTGVSCPLWARLYCDSRWLFHAWFGYFEYVVSLWGVVKHWLIWIKVSIWLLSTSAGPPDCGTLSSEKFPTWNFKNHFWPVWSVT